MSSRTRRRLLHGWSIRRTRTRVGEFQHLYPGPLPSDYPDGKGPAAEKLFVTTRNGTHLDAPCMVTRQRFQLTRVDRSVQGPTFVFINTNVVRMGNAPGRDNSFFASLPAAGLLLLPQNADGLADVAKEIVAGFGLGPHTNAVSVLHESGSCLAVLDGLDGAAFGDAA